MYTFNVLVRIESDVMQKVTHGTLKGLQSHFLSIAIYVFVRNKFLRWQNIPPTPSHVCGVCCCYFCSVSLQVMCMHMDLTQAHLALKRDLFDLHENTTCRAFTFDTQDEKLLF